MSALPPDSTQASRVRHELARELAGRCPLALGREIVRTGSAARGQSDDSSDVELNFWVDSMPAGAQRLAWLEAVGATDGVLDREQTADGSTWSDFRFRGVPVEAAWQPIAALEDLLGTIVAGQVTDHERLIMAWTIEHAIPLRTSSTLGGWQEKLSRYPESLAERLIASAVSSWTLWHFPGDRLALAARRDHTAMAQELVWDIQRVTRILFALNRQWEPEWKWLPWSCRDLSAAPDRLAERIEAIFTLQHPNRRVVVCLELIRDTLALLPASREVFDVRIGIEQSLDSAPARLDTE